MARHGKDDKKDSGDSDSSQSGSGSKPATGNKQAAGSQGKKAQPAEEESTSDKAKKAGQEGVKLLKKLF